MISLVLTILVNVQQPRHELFKNDSISCRSEHVANLLGNIFLEQADLVLKLCLDLFAVLSTLRHVRGRVRFCRVPANTPLRPD